MRTPPVLHLQLLWMINCPVAVHQNHGGGEVEDAGGQYQHLDRAVVRLTHGEGGGWHVETLHEEDNERVETEGGDPGGDDVDDGEISGEDWLMEIIVDLSKVAVQSQENKIQRCLLSERSSHHSLYLWSWWWGWWMRRVWYLTSSDSEWPALSESGVDSGGGDTQPCHQLYSGERGEQVERGSRNHPEQWQWTSES